MPSSGRERLEALGGHLGEGGLQGINMKNMASIKEELEQALTQGVKDGKIPHAVVYATNRDGSFSYSFATGSQNHGVDSTPIEKDAVFMLASQTKLLTSIACLQAVEQGLLTLDSDVAPIIPELGALGILKGFDSSDNPILEKPKNKITLRHLLTHTSGANYDMDPNIQKHQKSRGLGGTEQDLAATITKRYDLALMHDPGTAWMYGSNLDWAGLIIQRLSDLSLEEFMLRHIFAPLGINDITFWPKTKSPSLEAKIPQLTVRTPEGSLAPYTAPTLNSFSTDCFGGHGLYATLSSYNKIQQSLLSSSSPLLSQASIDELFKPQLTPETKASLNAFRTAFGSMIPGEVNEDIEWDHGLGGAIYTQSDVGRRKKGTMHWGGMTNPYWLIDREAGLAFTFGTQVLPPGDPACKEMTGIAERAVYKMAGVEF